MIFLIFYRFFMSPVSSSIHSVDHRHGEAVKLGIGDIFSQYGQSFKDTHALSNKQSRVISALSLCRTGFLGIHKQSCDECGFTEYLHNSCRDRHCPKCQFSAKESWLHSRMEELLPVPYYHVVFTLSHHLNSLIYQNQKLLYDLLFHSSSATLLQFGKDPKHLGAKLGFFGILHTWGQKLWYHPHLHYIVPGGGLSLEGSQWIESKYKGDFLFPVEAISQVFCGKFIEGLKKLWREGQLELEGELNSLKQESAFEELLNKATHKQWVIYTKKPFATPEKVLNYIARYTHRVAISNSRLESHEQGLVRFAYKDYQDEGKQKTCQLSVNDFIQRFLWHVLPEGFQKIRYYGFWAGAHRKAQLELAGKLIQLSQETLPPSLRIFITLMATCFQPASWVKCPSCQIGSMTFKGVASISLKEWDDTS